MTFAKRVFTIGGIWGVLIIAPLFFLEGALAEATGPSSHQDPYYGVLASTLTWPLIASPDLLLGVLFVAAWIGTRPMAVQGVLATTDGAR